MLKRALQSDIVVGVLAWLAAKYIRFVRATSTVIADPEDTQTAMFRSHPMVFAMWHGQIVMLPTIKPADMDVEIIVARHSDGELVGRTLEHFGMRLVRGAGAGLKGEDKGGAAALRAVLRALKAGTTVGLTADIPPGPGKRCGLGVVTIARLSGRPVVAGAMATSRFITFNSWNKFTFNLPFSKLGVVVGEPIDVPSSLDEEGMEAVRQRVEDELNRVTRRAYELVGASADKVLGPQDGETEPAPLGWRLKLYCFLTNIARPIAPLILSHRAKRGKEDPEREGERLGIANVVRPEGDLIWFHAASVGETNAVLPLIERLNMSHPDITILLTTGTVTSAQSAKRRLPPSAVHQYVPLDSPKFVARFLDHWKPDLALFTESEIWPNLILQASARDIPMMMLNGRMSKKSYRNWRRQVGLSRPLFSRFDLVLAQNDILANRFSILGAPQTRSVGNLKIDCPALPVDTEKLQALKEASEGRPIFIAASTHPGEDELVADAHTALRADFPGILTIIIPRHPERGAAIQTMLAARGISCNRRAEGALPDASHEIYIADTIGELGTFYALSRIAFVGGSIVARGGQNPVEPIKLGAAVLTGPHWSNFKDAYKELLRLGGCKEIHSAQELAGAVRTLLTDDLQHKTMTARAEEAMSNLSGALEETLQALEPYLPAGPGPQGMRRAS